jgi:hypothetical protein
MGFAGFEVGVTASREEVGATVEAMAATSTPGDKRLSSSLCAGTTPRPLLLLTASEGRMEVRGEGR